MKYLMLLLFPIICFAQTSELKKECYNKKAIMSGDMSVVEHWNYGNAKMRFCKTTINKDWSYCTEETRKTQMRINCKIFALIKEEKAEIK